MVAVLSIIYSISSGGTIDPNTPDNKYIDYGKNFTFIYEICGKYTDNTLFCASAVAIDSHWVLTAAHVVKNSKKCTLKKENKSFEIKDIFIHQDFNDKFGTADIAICYIKEDLELDFYPQLYESEDEVHKICSISGYGFTGTFKTGSTKHDGKQRAGSNRIDYIEKDLLICSPSKYDRTELEFLIASGDSGGGLFIGNKLAGINSCVLASDKKTDSSYGDESGHTRISKFISWIKETKKKKIKTVF